MAARLQGAHRPVPLTDTPPRVAPPSPRARTLRRCDRTTLYFQSFHVLLSPAPPLPMPPAAPLRAPLLAGACTGTCSRGGRWQRRQTRGGGGGGRAAARSGSQQPSAGIAPCFRRCLTEARVEENAQLSRGDGRRAGRRLGGTLIATKANGGYDATLKGSITHPGLPMMPRWRRSLLRRVLAGHRRPRPLAHCHLQQLKEAARRQTRGTRGSGCCLRLAGNIGCCTAHHGSRPPSPAT